MKNNNNRIKIIKSFDACASAFSESSNAMQIEFETHRSEEQTSGDGIASDRSAFLYYASFIVEFRYRALGLDLTPSPRSTLDCRVYLGKNRSSVPYSLIFLAEQLHFMTTRPLAFAGIANERAMAQAFASFSEDLTQMFGMIEACVLDTEWRDRLFQTLQKRTIDIIRRENPELPDYLYELYISFTTSQYLTRIFFPLMANRPDKAVKNLQAPDRNWYEKRLCRYLQTIQEYPLDDYSEFAANARYFDTMGVPKSDIKEFLTMFLSWIVLTIPILPFTFGFYYIFMKLEARGCVLLLGPSSNLPVCLIEAFILAICTSYFTRRFFYRLLFRKQYEQYEELDSMQNTVGSDKMMRVFTAICIVLSMAVSMLFVRWNVNFYPDGFMDNSSFFSVKGEFIKYSEVSHLVYSETQKAPAGNVIDAPAYRIVLKNGKEIDLYEFAEVEEYEARLIPFLESNGIGVE